MKQVILRKGQAVVEEAPPPQCGPGEVLVQNHYSVISSGTEGASLSFSGEPLWKKILGNPEKFSKGMKMLKEKGLAHTYKVVKGLFEFGQASGYSSAGEVMEVGTDVDGFKVGDFVACAGAGYANHAQIVAVPKNLVVKIATNISLQEAASATVGAIALQGARQADLKVGESAVVIGLGLLGQLTVQILRASGIRVLGIDFDTRRISLAKKFGLEWGGAPSGGTAQEILVRTQGFGADATIICAATASDEPINQAMEYTRKRGKVVIVGAIGLKLKRSPWYEKEIDLRISTSYGPGRYDSRYEEEGVDYPYAYVRWTENRNMQAYLDLIRDKKVNFELLVGGIYPIERAGEAYAALQGEKKPLAIVLEYQISNIKNQNENLKFKIKDNAKIFLDPAQQKKEGKVSVALIGAGNFAISTHLPNLTKLKNLYHLRAVVNKDGMKAVQYAKQYGADYAASDFQEVLNDKDVDAVVITTRHNLHAPMVLAALKAGKHVFVEKPLCLTSEELEKIKNFYKLEAKSYKLLMVGFNRRFSPYAQKLKEFLQDRRNPMIIHYRVNAGYIPRDHWVHGSEGGGRIIGEGCHFLDLFNFLIGVPHKRVEAFSIVPKDKYYFSDDNFAATLTYEDGSVASLVYAAMGAKDLPKEYVEIHCDGKTYIIDDFKALKTFGARGGFKTIGQDKGHMEELKQFAKTIKEGGEWPISVEEMIRATEQSFVINDLIKR